MQRGVFPEAQTRVCGDFLWLDRARRLGCAMARHACHVNRRLADIGFVQLLIRPAEAERLEVQPHHVIRSVEYLPRGGRCLVKILAHCDDLSALAGTENISQWPHRTWHGLPGPCFFLIKTREDMGR